MFLSKCNAHDISDTGKHPFHLHGHNFQAIARSGEDAGDFDATKSSQTDFPPIPMRRDTFVLYPEGYIVLRFQADNPGDYSLPPAAMCKVINSKIRSLAVPLSHRMAYRPRLDCDNG